MLYIVNKMEKKSELNEDETTRVFDDMNDNCDDEKLRLESSGNVKLKGGENCDQMMGYFMSDKIWNKFHSKNKGLSLITERDITRIVYEWNDKDFNIMKDMAHNGEPWYYIRDKIPSITSHFLPVPGNAEKWYFNKKAITKSYYLKVKGIILFKAKLEVYSIEDRIFCILRKLKSINNRKFRNTDLDDIEDYINNELISKNPGGFFDRMQSMNKLVFDGMKFVFANSMIKKNRYHCSRCLVFIEKKENDDYRLCVGCRTTYYCGKHCMKRDWPHHKKRCYLNRLSFEKDLYEKQTYLHDWF